MADNAPDNQADEERRRELEQYFNELSVEDRRNRIYLEPVFRDAYNEITQAHQVVQVPKYFWDHWVPIIGPVAATLYMKLRQYCYYNPKTGERRDWCWPKQETLAREIGVSSRMTLRKALVVLEENGFIKRVPQYRQRSPGGDVRRSSDKYQVYFEITLVQSDAIGLLIHESAKSAQINEEVRKAKKWPDGESAVENPPRMDKKRPYGAGQKMSSKKKYLEEVLNNVNVSDHKKEDLLQISSMSQEMVEQLGDTHSLGFYRLIARKMPESAIFASLSEVKDARLTGRLTKSRGAYFTYLIQQEAKQRGIDLEEETKKS